jgi:hypothetical protein
MGGFEPAGHLKDFHILLAGMKDATPNLGTNFSM